MADLKEFEYQIKALDLGGKRFPGSELNVGYKQYPSPANTKRKTAL